MRHATCSVVGRDCRDPCTSVVHPRRAFPKHFPSLEKDSLMRVRHHLMPLLFRGTISAAVVVGCLAVVCGPGAATAANIVWGSATTVSGDSDVDTTGSLVYAVTFGGTAAPPSTTVNGVTFSPFRIPPPTVSTVTGTFGGRTITISESPGLLFAYNTFGSGSAPFSGLSSSYQSMLGSGVYADQANTITVSLNGLTSGENYRLQWWTNDSAKLSPFFGGSFTSTTATAGNAVTLDANVTNLVGGLGQFAIGTFTASGTTQTFALTEPSDYQPLINGLQLRAVTVPEPSTVAFGAVGVGLAALIGWRRRMAAGSR